MEVTVVGAGIGGLALANGLVADGHRVRILEHRSSPSLSGAAVTIFCNGSAALSALGIKADDLGAPVDQLVIRRSDGRPLMRTDLSLLVRRFGHPIRSIPRAVLIKRLLSHLPAEAVEYGTPVAGVNLDLIRPVATDRTGQGWSADVLVGADGYRSVVRSEVLGGPPATQLGWATWQGLTPVLPSIAQSSTGLLLVGAAGLVGLIPAGAGLVQWWFDLPRHPLDPLPASPAARLRDTFSGYADPVGELLSSIRDQELSLYPHVAHRVPEAWGSGAVTLLGDAAHAFPPSQAQGANQALEDAWLLTRTLRKAQGVRREHLPAALRTYERMRTPAIRRVSRMATSERTNRPPNLLLGALARLTPAGLSSRAYARLLYSFSSVLQEK